MIVFLSFVGNVLNLLNPGAVLLLKWKKHLWSSLPSDPQPAFHLWKNFSQGIRLIRDVRNFRNKGKLSKEIK